MFDLNKNNWPEFQFSEIAEQISERIDPAESDAEVYVGLEHIEPNSIHIKEYGKPSDVKGTKLKVYKGDIIFGKRRAYQRKAAIANFDGICSAHAMVLRAKPKIMIPELFPFFLHSDAFMNRAIDISEGSLSPTIKWKILAKQKFTIPPLDDQRKLADLLWAGDELSNKKSDLIFSLNLYKNTLIEDTLFRSKEFNEVKLGDLGQLLGGVTFKNTDLKDGYSKTTTAVIRANNIKDNKMVFEDMYFVTDDKVQQNKILKDGDIAICMSNGNPNLVGKSAIVSTEKYPKISVGAFCSAFRPNHKNKEIVQLIFESYTYSQKVLKFVSGTNINNLRPDDLKNIKLRISKNISSKGINKIFKIFSSIKLNNENLVQLQKVNKSIINNIFS
ncbi:MAG: restriction endonuclease subunit S [Patescibacteria group bacterium]